MLYRCVFLLLPCLAVIGPGARAADSVPAHANHHARSQDPPPPPPSSATTQHVTPLAPVEVRARARVGSGAGGLGTYGDAPLHDTPAAITVIGRRELDDAQVRDLADLTRLDAALGDGYAPIGYIQNLTIRGYPLDLATGYRINNLTVTGQQYIAFEDKQQVQILQGLAGIDAGVMEPGGVVNYVTKRPADVQTATLGTDSHGSRYGAIDLGRWLTPDFGLRINAASEAIRAFVDHAHGHRHFYALAADWRMSARARLQLDSDWQGYAQRSVSAYQLLGGVALPEHVDRKQMLAWEPWQQPTTANAGNTSVRLDLDLAPRWTARVALGHSRSKVLDNAAFAYGCTNSPGCGAGATPAAWFAPNGNYDVWDFRSPGETYVDDEARATIDGHVGGDGLSQDLTFGASTLHHTVALPGEVFDFVGTANIDERTPPFYPPSPAVPGPVIPRLDSWQRTLFALDRVHFGKYWQLAAGAHFARLDQRAWDADGAPEAGNRMEKLLPQAALLWTPTPALTAYLSYSKGLSLGAQAPYWTTNAGDTLAPRLSRQAEAGVKYRWRDRLDLSAALYRIHQPWQFAAPDGAGNGFTFVERGNQVHTGIELAAHGRATDALRVDASIAWIRARAEETGVAAFEGHQVLNVPQLRGTLQLDYRVPSLPQLALLGGWQYASDNPATPDGRVHAPAYAVFDAGLRYTSHRGRHPMVWRLTLDNVFNRFYWRFTGSDGNDSYLLPGAPRLLRLTLEIGL